MSDKEKVDKKSNPHISKEALEQKLATRGKPNKRLWAENRLHRKTRY